MAIKKHNWISYGRQGEIVEITIKDSSSRKIDFFRCNNKKDYKRVVGIIKSKYGFAPETQEEEYKTIEEEKEWLKKDLNW